MKDKADPFLVQIPEAARLLGVGRSTIYRLINSKQLAIVRIGRRTLLTLPSVKKAAEASVGGDQK